MDAFLHFHARLLVDHAGEYVAIYQGKLVDHDSDQLALYQRVERRYRDTPVLIKQVLPNPEEEYAFVWSEDVAQLADHLGLARFAVIAGSQGGPFQAILQQAADYARPL